MKSIFRLSLAAAMLVCCASTALTAKAAIVVNNWTINFDAAFGTAPGTFGTISSIDQIGFTGLFHQQLDGAPAVGTRIAVDGLIQGTSLVGGVPASTVSSGLGILNSAFGLYPALKPLELTASFSVTNQISDVSGDVVTFTHEAAGAPPVLGATYDGLLSIYLDTVAALGGSGVQSDVDPTTGGAGFRDGVLIATFAVKAGTEGVLNLSELDGQDSATFELVSAAPGVLFDQIGNDLSTYAGPVEILLAIASSTLDLDNENNGAPDAPKPAGWPAPVIGTGFAFTGTGTFGSAFGQEDGSVGFELDVVPEPLSLVVWGLLGAAATAAAARRRLS